MDSFGELKKVRKFNAIKVPRPKSDQSFEVSSEPLDLEIGAGNGEFGDRYSKNNPNRTLISIEHSKERSQKLFRKHIQSNQPKNWIPIHGNAISWITWNIQDESLDKVFLMYPNPFPRTRDRHRRWPSLPFMQELVNVLKTGGEIVLASNLYDYILQTQLEFDRLGCFQLIDLKKLDNSKLARTAFERKYLLRGEICYELRYQKRWSLSSLAET